MKQEFRQFFALTVLIVITLSFATLQYYMPSIFLGKIVGTFIVLTFLVCFFRIVLPFFISRKISDPKSRYNLKKIFNISAIVIFISSLALIWIEESTSLLVTSSIIGAGIAFSLQDVFKNFVGAVILLLSETYRTGDRIEIGDHMGDVIDIGIMSTVIMEIRGWVQGDQVSGRLISIPNSSVINRPVINYTRDHSFIWDELSLPLTYGSNWHLAITVIEEIIFAEVKNLIPIAEEELQSLGEKYYLLKRATEPTVYISLTDNWIQLDARYISEAKNRRQIKNNLSIKIMSWIESRDDVEISSTTSTISIKQKGTLSKNL